VIRPLSNLSITVGARIEQENIHSQGFAQFDPQAESASFLAGVEGLPVDAYGNVRARTFTRYEDIEGAMNAIAAQFPHSSFLAGASPPRSACGSLLRRPGGIDTTNPKVAPRVSSAWDPWNDGKTKFSASAGRYFDKIFLAAPAAETEPVIVTFDAFSPAGS